jgi:hypothetical protein
MNPRGVAWIGWFALGACAPMAPAPLVPGGSLAEPLPDYRERLEARLAEVRAQDTTRFEIRLNRAACDCPPRELRLGERWVRVELVTDPDAPALVALLAAEADALAASRRTFLVEGEPAIAPGSCGQGALFLTFALQAYVSGGAEPTETRSPSP